MLPEASRQDTGYVMFLLEILLPEALRQDTGDFFVEFEYKKESYSFSALATTGVEKARKEEEEIGSAQRSPASCHDTVLIDFSLPQQQFLPKTLPRVRFALRVMPRHGFGQFSCRDTDSVSFPAATRI